MYKLQLPAVLQRLCDFAFLSTCQRVVTGDRYIFYFGIYNQCRVTYSIYPSPKSFVKVRNHQKSKPIKKEI